MAAKSKNKDAESKPNVKTETAKAAPKQSAAGKTVGETSEKTPRPGKRTTKPASRKEKPDAKVGVSLEHKSPPSQKIQGAPAVPKPSPSAKTEEPPKAPGPGATPIAQFMEITRKSGQILVDSKIAHLTPKREQPLDKQSSSRFARTVAKPDRLTPQERAAAGVKVYTDPKTHRTFRYDEQGRLTELESPSGHKISLDYESTSRQPSSFSVKHNEPPQLILRGEKNERTDIRVDQKTGDVTFSSFEVQTILDQETVVQRDVRIDHHVNADATREVITFDNRGHRLTKEIVLDGKDGEVRLLSRLEYHYTRTEDGVDDAAPARAVQLDARGRRVHEYRFENAGDLNSQRPSMRADITYSQSGDELQQLRREYDLAEGTPQLFSDTVKSVGLSTGEIAIVCKKYANGRVVAELNMRFDAVGRPVHLREQVDSADLDLSYTFKDGKPVSVVDAYGELDTQAAQALLVQGDLTIQDARLMYEIAAGYQARLVSGPTPPGQGYEATGTLVWKDANGEYTQARVARGTVYESHDQAVGKVEDTGEVTLDGPPARTFNILVDNAAAGAFHGIGSGGDRLDLCFNQGDKPEERREGFNGILTNGHDEYSLVGGNLYEESGRFIGHLDGHGRIAFDKNTDPPQETKDINSFLKIGWRFWGNENGQERSFDVGPSTANGKIFVPAVDRATGKPSVDENGNCLPPIEYTVRIGMIINQATGIEYGKLIPPMESNGKLEGGYVITDGSLGPVPLAALSGAVFDLFVIGQSGMPGRRIMGVSLAAGKQADGSYKPDSGGFLNLQDVLDVQKESAAQAAKALRSHDDQTRWYSLITSGGMQAEKTASLRAANELAQSRLLQVSADVEKILATGRADESLLRKLDVDTPHFIEKQEPPPKYLAVPGITSDNLRKVRGVLRLGNDQYDIYAGELYRVRIEHGKRTPETIPCGSIGPQYGLTFDRKYLTLGAESQALLKFQFEGDVTEHRLLGLGPSRVTDNGGQITGGLISADELLREAARAESEALKGNLEYFRNMPVLLGGSFDALMGNRGPVLINVQQSVSNQRKALIDELEHMFTDGFSGRPMDNNQIDRDVRAVQLFMNEMNLSTAAPTQDSGDLKVEPEYAPEATDVKVETECGLEVADVKVEPEYAPGVADVNFEPEYAPEAADVKVEPEYAPEAADLKVEPEYAPEAAVVKVEPEYAPEAADLKVEPEYAPEPEYMKAQLAISQGSTAAESQIPAASEALHVKEEAASVPDRVCEMGESARAYEPADVNNDAASIARLTDVSAAEGDKFGKPSTTGYVDVDAAGLVRSVILPKWGEQRSFEYQTSADGTHQLSEVTQPDGTVWKSEDGLHWSKEKAPSISVTFVANCEIEPDGTLIVKNEDGIRRYRSDGSETVQTPSGGHFLIQGGRLSQVIDAHGNTHRLIYDGHGELIQVEFAAKDVNRIWKKAGLDQWFVSDGATVNKYEGRVVGDVDGTITFEDNTGTHKTCSPDGSVTIRDPQGKETLQDLNLQSVIPPVTDQGHYPTSSVSLDLDEPDQSQATTNSPLPPSTIGEFAATRLSTGPHHRVSPDLKPLEQRGFQPDMPVDIARDRLSSLADQHIMSPVDLTSFRYATSKFEERAMLKGLSPEQVARTMAHVARLLDPDEGAEHPMLSHAERVHLAQQLMHQLAYPTSIDQGRNDTCTLAAIEVRTATLYPEDYARLIAEVTMTGKFHRGGSGPAVDMTWVRGALSPDSDATLTDKPGMMRVHPSQVFQLTAVNIHWQNESLDSDRQPQWGKSDSWADKPGAVSEKVGYEKVRPGSPNDTGERLVTYGPDARRELNRSPDLVAADLQVIMNEITGRADRGFTIANEEFVKSWNMWQGAVVPVAHPHELKDVLSEAKRAQKLPVIISVHTSHEPFWTDSGGDKAGGSGGWHMVCVTDFKTITHSDGREESLIYVDNPWGSPQENNMLRTMSPEVLYEATTRPKNG